MTHIMHSSTHKARRVTWSMALALFLLPIACDTLGSPLSVEPASRIPAELVENVRTAQLLSDGAVGDFECAFNAYTTQGGIIGEEFIYAQQTASRTPYDRRSTIPTDADYGNNSCQGLGVYTPLHVARYSNENLLRLLELATDEEVAAGPGAPDRTNLMAIAGAHAGYAYVLLGEGFCSMAVSTLNLDKTIDYGGEISRDSVFRLAIVRFTDAIAAADAAGNASIETMAYLGRARAKLALEDYAGARADALQVPPGYVRNITASGTIGRRQNRIAAENSATSRSISVGPPYRSMGDLRVPVTATALVSATGITHYYQTKYATMATAIPFATYEEAQLIIAEADIRANDLPAALPILEASRTRGGQGTFTGTTQDDYLAELIDQRRRELFAESHHLGDIIRFTAEGRLTLAPAAGTDYHFGGKYGDQLCLPLPAVERQNNPVIAG
jgi:hypothetical protein